MKNDSMFGKLDHIAPERLYENDPYFWIITPEGYFKYQMFSIYESVPYGETYLVPSHTDDEAFMEWLRMMYDKTTVALPPHVFTPDDLVVTLSTCTSKHTTRTIVQGVMVFTNVGDMNEYVEKKLAERGVYLDSDMTVENHKQGGYLYPNEKSLIEDDTE